MPLPTATPLQYLTMTILEDGERSGQQVREQLERDGEPKTLGAFYAFMSRLEDLSLVEGRYEQRSGQGYSYKERIYRITAQGKKAVDDYDDYFARRAAAKAKPRFSGIPLKP